jgi:hypothetical protein
LRRELEEEVPSLGSFMQGDILGAYRLPKDLNDGLGLLLLFYRVDTNLFEVSFSSEHEEYKWVGPGDIESVTNDPDAYISPGYLNAVLKCLE